MKDFRHLSIWKKAHQLTLSLYTITKDFPLDEATGLTVQIRNASIDISKGIVRAITNNGTTELGQHLNFAMQATNELDYLLLLSRDLNYMTTYEHEKLEKSVSEVKKMLKSFLDRLQQT